MIQLDKSTETNSFAFYPDVEVSSSVSQLRVFYDQDLGRATGSLVASITSKKNWVVGTIVSADLPNPSGQYTLTIQELTDATTLRWGITDLAWGAVDARWSDSVAGSSGQGQVLATERAYLEGGNGVSYTTYNSPNENGSYTTYNE